MGLNSFKVIDECGMVSSKPFKNTLQANIQQLSIMQRFDAMAQRLLFYTTVSRTIVII